MKFQSGVIGLIILAGLFTVSPYALFGGSVKSFGTPDQETMAALRSRSFTGAGAGGMQSSSDSAPDVRSCAKNQPKEVITK